MQLNDLTPKAIDWRRLLPVVAGLIVTACSGSIIPTSNTGAAQPTQPASLTATGFIEAEDGKEYFVHITGIQGGAKLREADPVTFEVEEGDRGLKAVDVAVAEGGSESSDEE